MTLLALGRKVALKSRVLRVELQRRSKAVIHINSPI